MSTKRETAQVDLIINGQSANASLRDLEAAARKVKAELRGLMPDTAEFNKAKSNFERINGELEKTRVQAGMAKSAWEKMKDTIKTTFIGNLGANLATIGLQKISQYFIDAWDSAKKLSDQIADIGRTTGMSADQVKKLNGELRKIDTRTSMDDLRNMAIVAGQFGIANDQIANFVKSVDKINVVMGSEFGGNAETVATEMSKLRNIFTDIKGKDIGTDIGFISNAITVLAQNGVATAPVVADMANRIGGYGIQAGLTTGQVLGLSATLQELNVSTERGGTAVVKIIQKMLTHTETFSKIAGMNVKDFEKLLTEDLFGAFTKVMEGSKKLGTSNTELAGIIKELEVQGAGASEVFAKLGSNTAMMEAKVKMANESLTNTNTITDQAKIKQDNFAGSVEKVAKAWNQLTTNTAILSFFEKILSGTSRVITGLSEMASGIKLQYDFITKGQHATLQEQAEQRKISADEEKKAADGEMKTRVQGQKNYYQQLSKVDLQALLDKKNADYLAYSENNKAMIAHGKFKSAQIGLQKQQELALEIAAAKEVINEKNNQQKQSLDEKRRLTKAEEKNIEKDAKAALELELKDDEVSFAEKRKLLKEALNDKVIVQREYNKMLADINKKEGTEQLKEMNRIYHIQIKMIDDQIQAAEQCAKKELEQLKKNQEEKWKLLTEFWAKEEQATLDLAVESATNNDEKYQAEVDRIRTMYIDKMALVKEGSAQYLLLEKQLSNDLDALAKQRKQRQISNMQSIAGDTMGVVNTLFNLQMQAENAKLKQLELNDKTERDSLKDKLEHKKISQQQYDAAILALDKKRDAEQKKIATEQANLQREQALFQASVKTILAWIEAFADIENPAKMAAAIAATAETAILAATPIPEFFEGGFTGTGGNLDNRGGFSAILHPNEYVINQRALQNPMVADMAKAIESGQINNSVSNQTVTNNNNTSDPRLIEILTKLHQEGIQGVWDFDYDKKSRDRIKLNDARRKM